jgi:hypothetical protein
MSPSHYLDNPGVFPTLFKQSLRSAGLKIFCDACQAPVTKQATILGNHVKSVKHVKNVKALLAKNRERDRQLQRYLSHYDQKENTEGSTIEAATRARRFEVAKAWLGRGLPFELFDDEEFRSVIEGAGPKLKGASTMRKFHSCMHAEELERLRKYLKGREVSVGSFLTGRCLPFAHR